MRSLSFFAVVEGFLYFDRLLIFGEDMDWNPVRPIKDEIEAVDIDSEKPDLVIIKIPLNKNPKLEWEHFFENPKALKGPIYSQVVRGDQVLVWANRDSPVEAVEQIFEYIESTNDRFEEFLEKNKDKFIDEEEKELEKITDKINDL